MPGQLPWPLTFHQYVFQGNSHDPWLGVRSLPTWLSLRHGYINSCVTKNRSDVTCNINVPYVVSGNLAIPGLPHLVTYYSSATFLNTFLSRKNIVSYMLGIHKILILEELCLFFNFQWLLLSSTFFYIDVRDSKVSFNQRNIYESSLFMGRLSNIQEFFVYGEIIEVRQNFLYFPNKNIFWLWKHLSLTQ